jgi:hypothetical protein
MKKFIDKAISAARKFNGWDFVCFKIVLIAGGILLGAYCASFFLSIIYLIWIFFIITFIWMFYITFGKYWGK